MKSFRNITLLTLSLSSFTASAGLLKAQPVDLMGMVVSSELQSDLVISWHEKVEEGPSWVESMHFRFSEDAKREFYELPVFTSIEQSDACFLQYYYPVYGAYEFVNRPFPMCTYNEM